MNKEDRHPVCLGERSSRPLRTARQDGGRPSQAKSLTSNGTHPVALVDMSVPQMAEAIAGLDRLETQYENMSGICATLKGLVLIEAKRKIGRGNWMPWVKENFPAKHKTANRYMRLAETFMGKLDSTVQFQTLTRDLAASVEALREFQLDLSHPVVARVAQWVNGRGAYQLMLDYPGERGGDTSAHRKKLSPAEERAAYLADCKTDFEAALTGLDDVVYKSKWKAATITDAHLELAAELCRQFARDIAAWLKTPARERRLNPVVA